MQAFPICFSQICLSLNGYKYSFFSGMFRCSDTTFVTFENRKFLFSRLTLFLLYLYSVFKVQVVLKV